MVPETPEKKEPPKSIYENSVIMDTQTETETIMNSQIYEKNDINESTKIKQNASLIMDSQMDVAIKSLKETPEKINIRQTKMDLDESTKKENRTPLKRGKRFLNQQDSQISSSIIPDSMKDDDIMDAYMSSSIPTTRNTTKSSELNNVNAKLSPLVENKQLNTASKCTIYTDPIVDSYSNQAACSDTKFKNKEKNTFSSSVFSENIVKKKDIKVNESHLKPSTFKDKVKTQNSILSTNDPVYSKAKPPPESIRAKTEVDIYLCYFFYFFLIKIFFFN